MAAQAGAGTRQRREQFPSLRSRYAHSRVWRRRDTLVCVATRKASLVALATGMARILGALLGVPGRLGGRTDGMGRRIRRPGRQVTRVR